MDIPIVGRTPAQNRRNRRLSPAGMLAHCRGNRDAFRGDEGYRVDGYGDLSLSSSSSEW